VVCVRVRTQLKLMALAAEAHLTLASGLYWALRDVVSSRGGRSGVMLRPARTRQLLPALSVQRTASFSEERNARRQASAYITWRCNKMRFGGGVTAWRCGQARFPVGVEWKFYLERHAIHQTWHILSLQH